MKPSNAPSTGESLALFGLREGFDQGQLEQRYKELMKKCHPDAGGSDRLAQLVNSAYRVLQTGQPVSVARADVPDAGREARTVRFRCACNGKPFEVVFAYDAHRRMYKPVRIDKRPRQSGSGAGASYTEPGVQSFDMEEFDFTGWVCPWCGLDPKGRGPEFIRCGKCNEYICAGRTVDDMFRCHDGCGRQGKADGSLTHMDGADADTRPDIQIPQHTQRHLGRGGRSRWLKGR